MCCDLFQAVGTGQTEGESLHHDGVPTNGWALIISFPLIPVSLIPVIQKIIHPFIHRTNM